MLQNVIFGRRCAKHVIDKSGELRLMKKKKAENDYVYIVQNLTTPNRIHFFQNIW